MSDDLIELQRRIDTLSRMLQEDQDEIARLRAEVERLTAALADERRHADALAKALANVEYMSRSHASDDLLVQHRARRQG